MVNYKFKQGKYNASGLHIGVHFGIKEQSYKVNFSKECLYSILNWENDWNKLCGWSYGLLPVKWEVGFSSSPDFRLFGVDYVWAHHYNSIRVCWRPFVNPVTNSVDTMELCIYVYEKGIRKTSEFTIILKDMENTDLFLVHDRWDKVIDLQDLGNKIQLIHLKYDIKPSIGYRLFPKFGGNDPTPHDMNIKLERV